MKDSYSEDDEFESVNACSALQRFFGVESCRCHEKSPEYGEYGDI